MDAAPNIAGTGQTMPDPATQALVQGNAPQISTPAPATQPAAQQPAPGNASAPAHGALAGILDALSGGGTQTKYAVDPNGQVTQSQAPVSTAGKWARILAGALTGLAAGAGQHGPGSVGRSFGAGFQGGEQQAQQVQQQSRQRAEQQASDIDANKTRMFNEQMRKASWLMTQHKILESAWNFGVDKDKWTQAQVDRNQALYDKVTALPGAQFVGRWDSPEAFNADERKDDIIRKFAGDGNIVLHHVVTMDKDGNPQSGGVEAFEVPKGFPDRPTDKEHTYQVPYTDPKTGEQKFQTLTVPAGQQTQGDAIKMSQVLSGAKSGAETAAMQAANAQKSDAAFWRAQATETAAQIRSVADLQKFALTHQPLGPEQAKGAADALAHYRLDAQTARYLLKDHPELIGEAEQINPNWSQVQYEGIAGAMKAWTTGKDRQELKAFSALVQHVDTLDQIISKLPNTSNIQVINKALANYARQTGNTSITSLDTLAEAISHEFPRWLSGGVPDIKSILNTKELMDGRNAPAQLHQALMTIMQAAVERGDGAAENLKQIPQLQDFNPAKLPPGAIKALQRFQAMDKTGRIHNPFDFSSTQPSPSTASGTGNQPQQGQQQGSQQPQQQAQPAPAAVTSALGKVGPGIYHLSNGTSWQKDQNGNVTPVNSK